MCICPVMSLIMRCCGCESVTPESPSESLLDQQPVRSDTHMQSPPPLISCALPTADSAAGRSEAPASSVPTGNVPQPLNVESPPRVSPALTPQSPTLRVVAHPNASPIVNSLEMYNGMLGGTSEITDYAKAAGIDESELSVEACAICTEDIILGPQSAVVRMNLPEGQRPRHFGCGHALHKDCFAIYSLSQGRSCPICKLEAPAAMAAARAVEPQTASLQFGLPPPMMQRAEGDGEEGEEGEEEGEEEEGEEEGEEEYEHEQAAHEALIRALEQEEFELQQALRASLSTANHPLQPPDS